MSGKIDGIFTAPVSGWYEIAGSATERTIIILENQSGVHWLRFRFNPIGVPPDDTGMHMVPPQSFSSFFYREMATKIGQSVYIASGGKVPISFSFTQYPVE